MRVLELDFINKEACAVNSPCLLDWTTIQISKAPIITRVYRESRAVALEAGHFIDTEAEGRWDCSPLQRMRPWLDTKPTIVTWDWVPDCQIELHGAGEES